MVKDLTKGSPAQAVWKYTVPMFLSVAFQQIYNIADSLIAGRFAGENALAAVGASYPITMLFNAIAIGSNIGCSVVIAKLFGSGEYKHMRTAITTTLISTSILSAVLTVFGIVGCPALITSVKTPENIFIDSVTYLKIYIAGFTFLFLYNIANAIFVAVGDSKTPLFFLICSSLGNIVLDYVFVKWLNLGVAGVAWATFIAQGLAAVISLRTVYFRIKEIGNKEKFSIFSFKVLIEICKIAVPSILQQSFVSVGNLFVQGIINSYGSAAIAGYSAAIKINTFCITCLTTMGNGVSGFTAQNLGAKKPERISEGIKASLIMSLFLTIPISILYFFCGGSIVGLFLKSSVSQAINIGKNFLRIVSPFYVFISIKIMTDGMLRGKGNMFSFMIATFTDLILRVVFAYVLSPIYGLNGVWISWPIGWMIATALSAVFGISALKNLKKTLIMHSNRHLKIY